MKKEALERGDLTAQIIGAGIEVHLRLGPVFESGYENAVIMELGCGLRYQFTRDDEESRKPGMKKEALERGDFTERIIGVAIEVTGV